MVMVQDYRRTRKDCVSPSESDKVSHTTGADISRGGSASRWVWKRGVTVIGRLAMTLSPFLYHQHVQYSLVRHDL
jgi:hypothetical protein